MIIITCQDITGIVYEVDAVVVYVLLHNVYHYASTAQVAHYRSNVIQYYIALALLR